MKKPILLLYLLLSIALPAEASKVVIEKDELYSTDGHLTGHRDIAAEGLDSIGFTIIQDYATFLVGEVSEEDLNTFSDAAIDRRVSYNIRPDYDLIQVNKYSFSSFGYPQDIPQDLLVSGYDGPLSLFLVQCKAPPPAAWHQSMRSLGAVIGYYPQNTFLIRASAVAMAQYEALDFVQYVGLFQPAYKVYAPLLDSAEPVAVAIKFDGGRDLTAVQSRLEQLLGYDVAISGSSSFRLAHLRLSPEHLRVVLHFPEVLRIEPWATLEWSGERQSMTVAGGHNGVRPDDPTGGSRNGYKEWLARKGFCLPDDDSENCMPYWTRVGVLDSGLDNFVCDDGEYNSTTGVCDAWLSTSLHPDLNH